MNPKEEYISHIENPEAFLRMLETQAAQALNALVVAAGPDGLRRAERVRQTILELEYDRRCLRIS